MSERAPEPPEAGSLSVSQLLREVRHGRIRIPPFQRGFRWRHENVRRLFDSIHRGYPVGSLVLWETDRLAGTKLTLGPITLPAPNGQALLVIDGQQRLTSLLGVLLCPEDRLQQDAGLWGLRCDLRSGEFVHPRLGSTPPPHWLPLREIPDAAGFGAWLRRLPDSPERETWLETANRVARALRDYTLPIHVIRSGEREAFQVFERLNTAGSPLEPQEVFTAIHAAEDHYDWTRPWIERDHVLHLDEAGFVRERDDAGLSDANLDLLELNSELPGQCWVLLGEPGLGKTYELRRLAQALRDEAAPRGDDVPPPFELADFSQDLNTLFENERILRWREGSHRLHLLLDGLDEARLYAPEFIRLLKRHLGALPRDRLKLYVTCRTAVWPEALERSLRELFPPDAVRVLELVPLTRSDVRMAAGAHGLDGEAFLEEVIELGVGAFARQPLGLRLLLGLYEAGGELPRDRVGLYRLGCRHLVEEESLGRQESGKTGETGVDERLRVARRIAAATLFGGRASIWKGPSRGRPPGSVAREELIGDRVTLKMLDETLDTALFSGRRRQRLGWGHQTYGEFLAAEWCVQQELELGPIRDLLLFPDGGARVVPQLREVAAWLATLRPDVFAELSRTNPDLVLLSDVAETTSEQRALLVADLFARVEADQVAVNSLPFGAYERVRHPQLCAQVEEHLRDRAKGLFARRLAVDIARACGLSALAPLCAQVALDSGEPMGLRTPAAYLVSELGDDVSRRELRPLTAGAPEDEDDELFGCALDALWPHLVTTQDVFPLLRPQRGMGLFGAYSIFLRRFELALSEADAEAIRSGLDWIVQRPRFFDDRGERNLDQMVSVALAVLRRGWELQQDAQVFLSLVAALQRLLLDDEVFRASRRDFEGLRKVAREMPTQRRRLLRVLCERNGWQHRILSRLAHSDVLVVNGDDEVAWVIGQIHARPQAEQEVGFWLSLLKYPLRWRRGAQWLEKAYHLYQTVPASQSALQPMLGPIALDSDQAEQMRQRFQRDRELFAQAQARRESAPSRPLSDRVAERLDAFEAGEISGFWHACWMLAGSGFGSRDLDLLQLKGWRELSTPLRERLLNAADDYLRRASSSAAEWIGSERYDMGDHAAVVALVTSFLGTRDVVAELEPELWRRWAPALVACWPGDVENVREAQRRLIALAYPHAQGAIHQAIEALRRKELARSEPHFAHLLSKLRHALAAERLRDLVRSWLDLGLAAEPLAETVAALLEHDDAPTIEWCRGRIEQSLSVGEETGRPFVASAATFLALQPRAAWTSLRALLEQRPETGAEVMLRYACNAVFTRGRGAQGLAVLDEASVAWLYVWLMRRFPPDEDPKHVHGRLHAVTPRDQVASLRNGLLAWLENRGTPAAVAALRSVTRELPEVPWLRQAIPHAERRMRQQRWVPPATEEILALGRGRGRRVESAQQLLDVVVASFRRFEAEIQGDHARVEGLWDNVGKTSKRDAAWRPKHEERLSDELAAHLKRELRGQGLTVGREVQVRPGELIDLHVSAITTPPRRGQLETLRLIVEVKGSWNRDVATAMETQLRDRYLRDNDVTMGLYVVGCYACAQWAADDDRRTRAWAKHSVPEAQARLDAQAAGLSGGGVTLRGLALNCALRPRTTSKSKRRSP